MADTIAINTSSIHPIISANPDWTDDKTIKGAGMINARTNKIVAALNSFSANEITAATRKIKKNTPPKISIIQSMIEAVIP